MADKVSLDASFNNCSIQTFIQLVSTLGSGCLQMQSIRLGSRSAELAHTIESTTMSRADNVAMAKSKRGCDTSQKYFDSASGLLQAASQAGITYFKGGAETSDFKSKELEIFRKGNEDSLNSARSAQEALTALARQILSR